jgi:hypothetical protein
MIGGALRVLFHRQYSAQAGQVNPDKSLLTNVIFVITVLTFDLLSRADELCEPCSIAKRLINDKSLLTNASRDFLFKRLLLLINVVERGIF